MKFKDLVIRKEERYSIGLEEESGKYYLSIPVANRLIDYEEYYEISKKEFEEFSVTATLATEFVRRCRDRELDERLIMKPGSDRGVAI